MNRWQAQRRFVKRIRRRWREAYSAFFRSLLAREIERAFADSVYPGDDRIGDRDVYLVRGDWRTLTDDLARLAENEIYFFSGRGLAYYIPAILLLCLRDPRMEPDFMAGRLSDYSYLGKDVDLDEAERIAKWNRDRLNDFAGHLTLEQTRVIAKFFRQFATRLYLWWDNSKQVEDDFPELAKAQAFWDAKVEEKLRERRASGA